MPSSTPSLAELRAVAQPAALIEEPSREHWAGRLYMRRLSPYVTLLLLRTPLSPTAITWLMIVWGVAAAAVLTLPGLWPALAAAVLIQLQLLFDCCDGEVARWRGRFSAAGVYLDKVGHYLTETVLPIALGIRADGGWDSIGGWTTLGLLAAVLGLLVKSWGHLAELTRAETGGAEQPVAAARPAARPARSLARARRVLGYVFPFFRVFVAIEASLLALGAAVVDALAGDLVGSRALVIAVVALGGLTAAGRLVAVLASGRLR